MSDQATQLRELMAKGETRKLFVVKVEVSAVILARDTEDARYIAQDQRAMEQDLRAISRRQYEVAVATSLPGAYDADSPVFNLNRKHITVEEAAQMTGSDILKGN